MNRRGKWSLTGHPLFGRKRASRHCCRHARVRDPPRLVYGPEQGLSAPFTLSQRCASRPSPRPRTARRPCLPGPFSCAAPARAASRPPRRRRRTRRAPTPRTPAYRKSDMIRISRTSRSPPVLLQPCANPAMSSAYSDEMPSTGPVPRPFAFLRRRSTQPAGNRHLQESPTMVKAIPPRSAAPPKAPRRLAPQSGLVEASAPLRTPVDRGYGKRLVMPSLNSETVYETHAQISAHSSGVRPSVHAVRLERTGDTHRADYRASARKRPVGVRCSWQHACRLRLNHPGAPTPEMVSYFLGQFEGGFKVYSG